MPANPSPAQPAAPVPAGEPPSEVLDASQIARAREASHGILQRPQGGERYRRDRELARGGMGVIYEALDQDLQRVAAMKVIRSRLADDPMRLRAFVDEARLTAQLEHPNIVPVHEIGVQDETGRPYYTMKRVEGEALIQIIDRLAESDPAYTERYTRHRLLDIFRKVCDAVAYAHSRGIIHRDIKPENVMVGPYGEVLLMDWGLAKRLDDKDLPTRPLEPASSAAAPSYHTQDGIIKGSLAYLSPEQAFGFTEDLDRQSDIFLLGGTLYHILAHAPPYDAETVPELLSKAERCDFPSPSERNPAAQIPLALERIVMTAMAPLRASRYPSVQALIDDLDAFVAGKRVCGRRIFAPGEALIRSGEYGRDTYVIISGRVRVTRASGGRETVIAELGHGDIVGEMAGITHSMRSATVEALTTTDTLVITHDLMMEELEKLPPWMEKIVFSLARRVRALDEQVHPLRLQGRSFPIVQQLYYLYCVGWVEAQEGAAVAFPRENLADEIALELGLERAAALAVIEVLVRGRLLVEDAQGALTVPEPRRLALFVEYLREAAPSPEGIWGRGASSAGADEQAWFRQLGRDLAKFEAGVPRRVEAHTSGQP